MMRHVGSIAVGHAYVKRQTTGAPVYVREAGEDLSVAVRVLRGRGWSNSHSRHGEERRWVAVVWRQCTIGGRGRGGMTEGWPVGDEWN